MGIKRYLTILVLLISSLILISADNPPPIPASTELQAELSDAFFQKLASSNIQIELLKVFTPELDTAFVSLDGKTAVIWLALRDESGRLLATEPGLVLAELTEEGWQIILPGEKGWDEALAALPEELLPAEHSPRPANSETGTNSEIQTLHGYYLPYAAGTSRWLEGSISHFQSIPELGYPSCTVDYCRYAFDFTDDDHFPILASKGGSVYRLKDSCSNGNESCTNYIILYNSSDGAYQIYLHLANGSIPNSLGEGSSIVRGQYLGDTDDTGYSTSNHVHFMVVNSIWAASGYYWGQSIDIRFQDVGINDGLPRTCYEVTSFPIYDGADDCLGDRSDPRDPDNDWFESGNVGAFPPSGSLTRPEAGKIVAIGNTTIMDVSANASDDVSVTKVRLVAKISNQWTEIGPTVTQPAGTNFYDWDVNLCNQGLGNGPLEVGLRVWDHEGNVSSVLNPRTIQVDYACPAASQLNPAVTFASTAVQLTWGASNVGTGFGTFQLQYRTVPGSWSSANMLTFPVTQRSTWFVGQPGSTYAFRLRIVDNNGVAEAWPANDAAETTAALPATCTEDGFEQDDTWSSAKPLIVGVPAQRNLCGSADPDWFQFSSADTGYYLIRTASLSGGAATRITLYASNHSTVLASSQAAGLGQAGVLLFKLPSAGSYYLKIEPLVSGLFGTAATYEISVSEVDVTFMPLVMK
jgi:murein DD-endopeptidase MepM/ murein hydrolase activator NlpD